MGALFYNEIKNTMFNLYYKICVPLSYALNWAESRAQLCQKITKTTNTRTVYQYYEQPMLILDSGIGLNNKSLFLFQGSHFSNDSAESNECYSIHLSI